MTIHPSSNVVLYIGIPFSPSYQHTMYFSSIGEQISFFSNWSNKTEFQNYSYVRNERRLKVQPVSTSRSMWSYNYISFVNPDGSRFYGFITDIDYINNNTYAIQFDIDIFQTFFTSCTMNQCLVDREHVSSDNKGEHTESEPFDAFGQLVYECVASPVSNVQDVPTYSEVFKTLSGSPFLASAMFGDISMCTVLMCTQDITKIEEWNFAEWQPRESLTPEELYGNIYNGMYFYAYWINSSTDLPKISAILNFLNEKGQSGAIQAIFMAPLGIFETSRRKGGEITHGLDFTFKVDNTKLGVYTPKNNKLYTYPYNYLYVTNNEGNAAVYKFEYFDKYQQDYGACFFAFTGQIAPGCVLGVFPRNYTGSLYNTDAMITTSPYPLCSWTTDVYQAYVALNSGKIQAQQTNLDINRQVNAADSIYNGFVGFMDGMLNTLVGGMLSAITPMGYSQMGTGLRQTVSATGNMASQYAHGQIDLNAQARMIVADMYDISVIPRQAHGNQSGDVIMSSGSKGLEFFRVYPNSESAKIIDDYFTQFGYHRGIIKVPELTSRKNFNYVKTSGCNVTGAAPAYAINEINKIFDTGITLWHNISTYGNYLSDNSIV